MKILGEGDGERTLLESWAGAMVGELCQNCGRGRWFANCVKIMGGGDGGRNLPRLWAGAFVGELCPYCGWGRWFANCVRIVAGCDGGELCRDRGQGRYLVLTVLKIFKIYGALFYMTNVANHFPLAS